MADDMTPLAPSPAEPLVSPSMATPSPRLPAWRFWVPLLMQMGLLIAVPAQDAYTYAVGTTIVLDTRPVDPYDFLRGYSQTLSYQISDPLVLQSLPSGDLLSAPRTGQTFYLILQQPRVQKAEDSTNPPPWSLIRISESLPEQLPPNQVALAGKVDRYGSLEYGLERYYMPADRRDQLNTEISNAQWSTPETLLVEAKVDKFGNAVPLSLWVNQTRYQF